MKMNKYLAAFCSLSLLFASLPVQASGLNEKAYLKTAKIFNNEANKTKTIYLFRTESLASTPEEAAQVYIASSKETIGLSSNDELELVKQTTNDIGYTFHYRQIYKGIPVHNSEFVISVSPEGEVFYVSELLKKGLDEKLVGKKLTPISSSENIIECVKNNATDPNKNTDQPELQIYFENEVFRLIWRVLLEGTPAKLIFLSDANCEIVQTITLASHVTGTGLAYEQNPTSTPTLSSVSLTDLIGNGTLQGTFFDLSVPVVTGFFTPSLENIRLPSVPANSNSFDYTPDIAGGIGVAFVNVYHNLTKAKNYFETNFNFRQDVKLDVFLIDQQNAFYAPPNILAFGQFIDQGIDIALDGDSIAHEYAHYVQDSQNNTIFSANGSEARGIGEGVSDYFATSIYDDDCLGEYLSPVISSVLGSMCTRDLTNMNSYPSNIFLDDKGKGTVSTNKNIIVGTEEHAIGDVWGPFLADIRRTLGKNIADKIVFNSLALLPQNAFVANGLVALIQADQGLNNGTNIEKIRELAASRGIYENPPVLYSNGIFDTFNGIVRHTSLLTGEQTDLPLVFFQGREHNLFFQGASTLSTVGLIAGLLSPDQRISPATILTRFSSLTILPILVGGEGGISFGLLPIQAGGFLLPMNITNDFPIGEYLFGVSTVTAKKKGSKNPFGIQSRLINAKVIPFGSTINAKYTLLINSMPGFLLPETVNVGSNVEVSIDPPPEVPITFTVEPMAPHPAIELSPTSFTLSKESPSASLGTKKLKVSKAIIKRSGTAASYSIRNDGKGGYIIKSFVVNVKGKKK